MAEDQGKDNSFPSNDNLRSDSNLSSEWEVIPEPPTPLEEHKHLIPPVAEKPKLLCGYLKKETTHSLIKTYRQRWVMFDDDRCCLLYYNTKADTLPQGSIDISTATFAYSVENLFKNQFEIQTPTFTYNFQANTQEAMFQWIEALQKKRRKFGHLKKEMATVKMSKGNTVSVAPGGLVGKSNNNITEEEEEEKDENGVVVDSDQPAHSLSFTENHIPKIFRRTLKHPRLSSSVTGPGGGGGIETDGNRKSNFYVNFEAPEEDHNEDKPYQFKFSDRSSLSDIPNAKLTVSPMNGTIAPHSKHESEVNSQTDLTQSETVIEHGSPRLGWLSRRNTVMELLKKVSPRTNDQSDILCPKCQKLEESIDYLERELSFREQDVKNRDELIDFFRKEIKHSEMQDEVRKELSNGHSTSLDKKIDIITQRDQIIQSLQKTLEQLRGENDSLEAQLRSYREKCSNLSDDVALYKETIKAKDHVVVDLTNKLFSMEKGGQIPIDPRQAMLPTTNKMLELQILKLKEIAQAYKDQNVFLSCEIVELNQLRSDDSDAIRALNSKLHEKEAEYIRLQSKHIILLKEAQTPKLNQDSELVSQMMQEAIQPDHQSRDRSSSEALYDSYGFKHELTLDAEPEETLDLYVRRLDQQAHQTDESVASHVAKWDHFMTQFVGRDLVESDELKAMKPMIRCGIPKNYRGRIWKWCIREHVGDTFIPGLYKHLLAENAGQPSVALNQIELDLLRTLPSNKYYNSPDAPGIAKLRRVLVAFSWYNTLVGYCQGLNRLAAIALLFLEEEDAFWCLVAVVDHILPPDYYNKTLLGSQSDQRVLRVYISEKMPRLSAHLDTCDIDFSLITFNWFHTIFIDNLPIETTLRIWDTFLHEGSKVLFRFAIAIFKYNEESLLAQANSILIFNRLRTIAQEASDVNKLTQIAFYDPIMRSFSRKKINARRAHFRQIVQAELDNVDRQRSHTVMSGVVRYPDIESDDEEVL